MAGQDNGEKDLQVMQAERSKIVNRLRFDAAKHCMAELAANTQLEPVAVAQRSLDCADALLLMTGHIRADKTGITLPAIPKHGDTLGDPRALANLGRR